MRVRSLRLSSHSLPKMSTFIYHSTGSTRKYSQLITHGPSMLSCSLVCTPNTEPYWCNAIQVYTQPSFPSILSSSKPTQVISAIPPQIEFWVYSMFFSRHSTDSELLYSLDLHFTIPEAVIIEINTKRFSLLLPALCILY